MYRIMVVDDEPHVVHWIYDLLTEQLPFEAEIYTAYSAVEAFAKIEKANMDVVITDIRMPKMSGLELMDAVISRWGDTRIIFLTGYDEFDYVYKAISREGVSYILKTEDDDVLLGAVEQAVQAIEKRSQSLLTASRQHSLLRLLGYRDIVSGFVAGRLSYAYVREKLPALAPGVSLEHDVALMAAKLDLNDENRFDLYAGIEMLMTEILSGKLSFLQADYSENILVWLVQDRDGRQTGKALLYSLQDAADRVIEGCGRYWGLTISFAIAPGRTAWKQVPEQVTDLLYSEGFSSAADKGTVVVHKQHGDEAGAARPYADYCGKLNTLKLYLEQGRQEQFTGTFHELASSLAECPAMGDPYAAELYARLSLLMLGYVNQNRLHERLKLHEEAELLVNSTAFTHWKEAADYLEGLSGRVFELQRQELQRNRSSLVYSIECYIDNNIAGDLSLTAIGEALNYNPSYLSRIFKQMTGVNLLKFIVERKLQKAIQMLTQSTEPVNSVGRAVGFDNPAYFAKVFRKFYDMTPQEYRENSVRF